MWRGNAVAHGSTVSDGAGGHDVNREQWRESVRHLSLEEFRTLQEVVAEEYHAREAEHFAKLRVGDWVEFEDRYGQPVRGTVQKMNRRTVDVHSDGGGGHDRPTHWKVSVSLVRRVLSAEPTPKELPSRTVRNEPAASTDLES